MSGQGGRGHGSQGVEDRPTERDWDHQPTRDNGAMGQTGKPLHPSLIWNDGRTAGVVKRMIEATPTKSLDHLRVSHATSISVVN